MITAEDLAEVIRDNIAPGDDLSGDLYHDCANAVMACFEPKIDEGFPIKAWVVWSQDGTIWCIETTEPVEYGADDRFIVQEAFIFSEGLTMSEDTDCIELGSRFYREPDGTGYGRTDGSSSRRLHRMIAKHSPFPWWRSKLGNLVYAKNERVVFTRLIAVRSGDLSIEDAAEAAANTKLVDALPALISALHAARKQLEHLPPDCWATGPMTGDPIQDLVACPGCGAIHDIDAALDAAGIGNGDRK